MAVAKTIETKLRAALSPVQLGVSDESRHHVGHAGSSPGGETHFRVEIVSDIFEGMSRLARQRLVHRILADELSGPIHALTITAITASEAGTTSETSATSETGRPRQYPV